MQSVRRQDRRGVVEEDRSRGGSRRGAGRDETCDKGRAEADDFDVLLEQRRECC